MIRILCTILIWSVFIGNGFTIVQNTSKVNPSAASITAGDARAVNAQPVVFSSPDFERLLRESMGKTKNEPIYADELEPIALINLSDDLITFEWRLHEKARTSKTITDISLLDLRLFPNLVNLYICDIAVHDIEIIPKLPSLRELSLIGCSLDGCEVFSDMKQLTYLSLARNDIHSLEPLSGLTQLQSLNITSNPISTIAPLESLVNLTDFTCAGNAIADISIVTHMPNLQALRVQSTNITSLEPLRNLARLQMIDASWISEVILSLEPLQGLEKLDTVLLMGTKVDDLAYISQAPCVVGGDEMGPPAHIVDAFGIEENEDGSLTITAYLGSEPRLTLPAVLGGKPVTRIGESAFESCDTLVSVEIPAGVSVIEDNAFSCCPLESVSLPDGLTKIGNSAFRGCSYLASVVLPSSLQKIGRHAFDECGLTSVELPENVRELSGKSFGAGTRLMPATNHPIYEVAGDFLLNRDTHELVVYMGNTEAQEITVPQGVTRIGLDVFFGCKALRRISIPSGVTSIGGNAFTSCSALSEVEIAEGLTDIEFYAFSWCPVLERLQLPESLKSIGNFAFFECTGMKEMVLPDNTARLGNSAFMRCTSLTRVVLSRSLSAIESMTFFGCSALEKIYIPSSVSFIGYMVFTSDNTDWSSWTFEQGQKIEPHATELHEPCFMVCEGSYAEEWLCENGFDNVAIWE